MSEKHRCSETEIRDGTFRGHRCTRTAKNCEGGNWYCQQHTPSRDAADKKFQQQWEARKASREQAEADAADIRRKAELFDELVEALEAALVVMNVYEAGTTAGASYARDVLTKAKATGGK